MHVNKEVLYANSIHALNQRIKFKVSNGWQLVGEIKQNYSGKYGYLMTKEIPFK